MKKLLLKNKIVKILFSVIIILFMAISVSINVLILTEQPCFGAKELEHFLSNENGDEVYFSYNGYNYAKLDYLSKYSVNSEIDEKPITRYMCGYLDSTFNEYNVYGYQGDDRRLFLWCDYNDLLRPYGGVYYRSDLVFPEITENTVESLAFYKLNDNDEEILVRVETDEYEISKWIVAYRQGILKDLNGYYDDGIKLDNVYCVYAVFDSLNLKYEIAYVNQETVL